MVTMTLKKKRKKVNGDGGMVRQQLICTGLSAESCYGDRWTLVVVVTWRRIIILIIIINDDDMYM